MVVLKEKINFLQKAFGEIIVAADGIEATVKCPNCREKVKKKLCIRLDNDCFHCWVCNIKGKNLYHLLKNFKPQHLNEYRQDFLKQNFQIETKVEEASVILPEDFKLLGPIINSYDPQVKAAINYIKLRGLSETDVWRFRMGISTEFKWMNRIIIPSFCADGNLNYLVGRSMDPQNTFKYLNAKVQKKNIIFNEIDINWSRPLTLVEGPFDLFKCTNNAACLLGSYLDEEYQLFKKIIINKTPIVFGLDEDAISKTLKMVQLLESYDIDCKIMYLPKNIDIGQLTKKQYENFYAQAEPINRIDALRWKIKSLKPRNIL